MTIEQRARDLLNAAAIERGAIPCWPLSDTRDNSNILEAVCRALEAHDQTQAAFDAYRREVSEHNAVLRDALRHSADANLNWRADHIRFIIPEPVDPLTAALRDAFSDDDGHWSQSSADALRAALAKIGGKVVFGEGA